MGLDEDGVGCVEGVEGDNAPCVKVKELVPEGILKFIFKDLKGLYT